VVPDAPEGREVRISLREAVEKERSRPVFSSGSDRLDRLLGSGFRSGEMVEIYGESATGKTQLGIQSAILVASLGLTSGYVDTEGQFRPEKVDAICRSRGLDPDAILPRIYLLRAEGSQQQRRAVGIFNERLKDCRMVVVDTVTRNFSLEYPGAKMVPARQAALGAYLNLLSRDAYMHGRAVLLLNRVAATGAESASRDVDIGGDTLRHFVQKAIHLSRTGSEITAVDDGAPGSETITMRITDRGLG
jgi:DNA repair protein RadA